MANKHNAFSLKQALLGSNCDTHKPQHWRRKRWPDREHNNPRVFFQLSALKYGQRGRGWPADPGAQPSSLSDSMSDVGPKCTEGEEAQTLSRWGKSICRKPYFEVINNYWWCFFFFMVLLLLCVLFLNPKLKYQLCEANVGCFSHRLYCSYSKTSFCRHTGSGCWTGLAWYKMTDVWQNKNKYVH